AKTGAVFGAFTQLLIVMKGLPLAYSKDMQEDKVPAFEALDTLSLMITAMTGMVEDMEPDAAAMRKAAGAGYSTATDLADWLVRTLDMPFRDAHHVTGQIVSLAEEKGIQLARLKLEDMQKVESRITEDIFSVLSVQNSVKSRKSFGGTAPSNVRKMARGWIKRLERDATSG
ncbi:MAG: argininosuccinate lyase, partial [Gammaproteobacteria bacterium]|nr:argininosuccinate lyase [Gammaproteobacteria bacterium]